MTIAYVEWIWPPLVRRGITRFGKILTPYSKSFRIAPFACWPRAVAVAVAASANNFYDNKQSCKGTASFTPRLSNPRPASHSFPYLPYLGARARLPRSSSRLSTRRLFFACLLYLMYIGWYERTRGKSKVGSVAPSLLAIRQVWFTQMLLLFLKTLKRQSVKTH